jgi:hypothetical protein
MFFAISVSFHTASAKGGVAQLHATPEGNQNASLFGRDFLLQSCG